MRLVFSFLLVAFLIFGVVATDSTTTTTTAKPDEKESTTHMTKPRLTTSEEKQTMTKLPTTNGTTLRNDTTVLPIANSGLSRGGKIGCVIRVLVGIGIPLAIIAIVSIAAAFFGWKYYKKGYRFPYFWRAPAADAKPANDKAMVEPAFIEESQKNQMGSARNV